MPSPKSHKTGAKAQTEDGGTSAEDEAYKRCVRKQIKSGLADIKAGRVISHEKMLQKFGIGRVEATGTQNGRLETKH